MRIPLYAACLLFGCLVSVARAQSLRTVTLSGIPAPGTPGVNFSFFDQPNFNNTGQTAFFGFLTGPGVGFDNSEGIWSEGGGSGLTLVARMGNAAPGTGGADFSDLGLSPGGGSESPTLNNAGQTAFRGDLTGTGVNSNNDQGIWSEGGGSGLALVVRKGSAAPGTSSGVNFSSFGRPVFNDAGQTAFSGFLTGTGVSLSNYSGIWSEGGGNGLALIARNGSAAPDTPAGVNFSGFNSQAINLSINNAGQIVFRGDLNGTGVNSSNNRGIWSEGGGAGLALVAREGEAAPGTSSSVNFSDFAFPALNDSGQIAFRGELTGTGVDSSNNLGIWSEGGGSGLTLVVRKGDAAPDMSSGINFSGLLGPAFNNAGQVAFLGFLTGTGVNDNNDGAIWVERGGTGLALVAREGSAAPGTSGASFSSLPSKPTLNSVGQTAFTGFLAGAGVNFSNYRGIWAEDPSGVLKLIARTGDLLDVDDGPGTDFRTINSLSLGRFNNLGQLVFRATFTDSSSGIFVSNLVAIPEPSTLFLGAFAAAWMLVGKRRQSVGSPDSCRAE